MAEKQDNEKKKSKPIEEEADKAQENEDTVSQTSDEEPIPMIMIPKQEFEELKTELEKIRGEVSENYEGWQRERADFINYKKRIERDQIQKTRDITGEIIKKYLPVMDDIERALKARPVEAEGAKWADGIELIYRKLSTIVENSGVERIEAEKTMFDPTIHEAITSEPSDEHESGEVIEVIQQGYKLGDRVLRPALVRVAQ